MNFIDINKEFDAYEGYEFKTHGVRLPEIKIPAEEKLAIGLKETDSNYEFLKALARKGFKELNLQKGTPEYKKYNDRAKYELEILEELGFTDYILMIWDIINFCKKNNIATGAARGSSAGSLLMYLVGITEIDSIKYGLYFERFVSKTRAKKNIVDGVTYLIGSLPDTDLDLCLYRRGEVVEYLKKKYNENVCNILRFNTLSGKLVIKEIGKVVGEKSETEMKFVADQITRTFGKVELLEHAYENKKNPKFKEWADENKESYQIALKLSGLIKNKGVHPSGILVSYEKLSGCIATELSVDKSITSSIDMDYSALIAIKVDCLGLKNVSIIKDACDQLNIKMKDIEVNNPFIYQQFQDLKYRTGLFQIEADTNYKVLRKVKPKGIEELSAVLALSRPGALSYVDQYSNYANTGTFTEIDPLIDEVLKSTGGVCLAEGTKIFNISNSSFVNIEDCKSGDLIQSLNENNYEYEVDKVARVIYSGEKEVYKITINDGSYIEATEDHEFLTEFGWIKLKDLTIEDYLLVPNKLIHNNEGEFSKEKLRVLAYLIGDGDVSGPVANGFTSKNNKMLEEYIRCVKAFENTRVVSFLGTRDVTRISTAQDKWKLHQENTLVSWLRQLGLKTMDKLSGCSSDTKFIPEFVFTLNEELIAFFIASLWDCDGGINKFAWYYTTISKRLAYDIKNALSLIGIHSRVHGYKYQNPNEVKTAYKVFIQDTYLANKILKPHIINLDGKSFRDKRNAITFSKEMIYREINEHYGESDIQRHLFHKKIGSRINGRKKNITRLSESVTLNIAKKAGFPILNKNIKLRPSKIIKIEKNGTKKIYDLEIKRNHNFIANGFSVHNCIFQESVMQLFTKIGFSLSDSDDIRRIIGKKDSQKVLEWKDKIYAKCEENKIDIKVADLIWKICDESSNYQFNKSHSISYSVLTAITTYLKFKYPKNFFLAILRASKNDPNPREGIEAVAQELGHFNIKLLSPDINKSELDFSIEGDNIRFGISSIKGMGGETLEKLSLFKRENKNKFEIFQSFKEAKIGIGVVSSLIQAGAVPEFKNKRSYGVLEAQLWGLLDDKHGKERKACLAAGEANGFNLIQTIKAVAPVLNEKGKPTITEKRLGTIRKKYALYKEIYEKNSQNEKFANWFYEKKLMGYSSGVTLKEIFSEKHHNLKTITEALNYSGNESIKIVGHVDDRYLGTSRKGEKYLRLSIKDDGGTVTCLAFKDSLDEIKAINGDKFPDKDNIVIVHGRRKNDAIFIDHISIQDSKIYIKLGELKDENKESIDAEKNQVTVP